MKDKSEWNDWVRKAEGIKVNLIKGSVGIDLRFTASPEKLFL